MPLSTDVNLPKSQMPIFPDRCVACGQPQPGENIQVCTHALGWRVDYEFRNADYAAEFASLNNSKTDEEIA